MALKIEVLFCKPTLFHLLPKYFTFFVKNTLLVEIESSIFAPAFEGRAINALSNT